MQDVRRVFSWLRTKFKHVSYDSSRDLRLCMVKLLIFDCKLSQNLNVLTFCAWNLVNTSVYINAISEKVFKIVKLQFRVVKDTLEY